MPLDPQAKALMDQMAAAAGPKLNTLEPADARRLMAGMFRVPPERADQVAKVEDRKIPGPAGEMTWLLVRISPSVLSTTPDPSTAWGPAAVSSLTTLGAALAAACSMVAAGGSSGG